MKIEVPENSNEEEEVEIRNVEGQGFDVESFIKDAREKSSVIFS